MNIHENPEGEVHLTDKLHIGNPEGIPTPPTERREAMKPSPESKVFKDYVNEFQVVDICLKDVLSREYDMTKDDDVVDLKFIAEQLNERFMRGHLRKYEERYPKDKYEDVLTDDNMEIVQELNEKVEQLNQLMLKNWTSDDLVSLQEKDRLIKANVLCSEIISLVKDGKKDLVPEPA